MEEEADANGEAVKELKLAGVAEAGTEEDTETASNLKPTKHQAQMKTEKNSARQSETACSFFGVLKRLKMKSKRVHAA